MIPKSMILKTSFSYDHFHMIIFKKYDSQSFQKYDSENMILV